MTLRIRSARSEDAPELALLSKELGHGVRSEDVALRLEQLLASVEDWVGVTEELSRQRVLAWIHVGITNSLVSGRCGLLRGLVVAPERQGSGLGRALLQRAERWCFEQGVRDVRLRSRVERERARSFYEGQGYTLQKTQHLYGKRIADRP